jgi:hypothetical protein
VIEDVPEVADEAPDRHERRRPALFYRQAELVAPDATVGVALAAAAELQRLDGPIVRRRLPVVPVRHVRGAEFLGERLVAGRRLDRVEFVEHLDLGERRLDQAVVPSQTSGRPRQLRRALGEHRRVERGQFRLDHVLQGRDGPLEQAVAPV